MRARLAVLVLVLGAAGCGRETEPPEAAEAGYVERMAEAHRHDAPVPTAATEVLPAVPVTTTTVEYAAVDGQPIRGFLAYPSAAEGGLPAVLLFHEWWGLNDNIRAMARQLAAQGYVAFAADLFRGQVADTPEAARDLLQKARSDPAALDRNIQQAHAYLRTQIKATRVGTIGWCFGGGVSLRAAQLLRHQLDAAIIYYGHVQADAQAMGPIRAPILGIFGGADEGIPLAQVRAFESALKAQNKPAEIHVYEGAGHGFANPSGRGYRAEAAADAWEKSLRFLGTHLKGG